MANMVPPRANPKASDAEQKVFAALRDQLEDDYVVLHHVRWYDPGDARQRVQAYEADFIVLHSALGILDLEVKGGGIRFDPVREAWFTTDRFDVMTKLDESPLEQALKNSSALWKLVKRSGRWRGGFLTAGHAAILPDCRLQDVALPPSLPRELLLDKGDLIDLRKPIAEIYRRHSVAQPAPLGKDGVQMLIELIGPQPIEIARTDTEIRIRVPLGKAVRQEAAEMEDLTERLRNVLCDLRDHPRALVSGGAGSGKTFLAQEHAKWLAQQGNDVLFLCFNKFLAADLRRRTAPEPRIEATHFHLLCLQWAEAAGERIPTPEQDPSIDAQQFYNEILPQKLLDALPRTVRRYHALFVDEAQDFRTEWWIPLLGVLHDETNGFVYVFQDDTQAIFRQGPGQDMPQLGHSQQLGWNLRNTQRIHEVVCRFSPRARQSPAFGPLGREVEVVPYEDDRGLTRELSRVLHRLLVEERVSPEDLVVLTQHRLVNTPMREGNVGNFVLTTYADRKPEGAEVFTTTIHAFKGLEKPVVVLAGIEPSENLTDGLLYVGCSRARSHLVVLCRKGLEARFLGEGRAG